MNKQEELLNLSLEIVNALESKDLVMEQKDKDALQSMNESMSFFTEQGNFDRAISEGKELLKRLDEIW